MNILIYSVLTLFCFIFLFIIYNYAKGLKDSPREIWFLLVAKLIEYAAYGASNMTFVLYLSQDCGLGDIEAGSFIGTWSTFLTLLSILVGSVVDAIGIKKTLLLGVVFLFFGRIVIPFSNTIWLVTIFSFIPVAVGNAILGPVLSVGIKKYTTPVSSALGFGLYYTLMNVGFALGGYIFDKLRTVFGEHGAYKILGISLSTYQLIFLSCFLLTIPSFIMFLFMRDGIYMNEEAKIEQEAKTNVSSPLYKRFYESIQTSFVDTIKIMKESFTEKSFWVYLFILSIFVFIKLIFYHFHYTFPKYGIRVLGDGVKIGNIYGILNPVMIIFLVPLISHFTKKIKSYYLLLIGTTISATSIFIAAIPETYFSSLLGTWFGDLVLVEWLELRPESQNPVLFSLLFFIVVFTIGEAIWSPRLFQFSAEIAPKGREGTYLALSYLPYFFAKMIAGPLSGFLISIYVPANAKVFPDHYMIWIWIGLMSVITPIGLILSKNQFKLN
ncbi:MAG: MFS transporter [Leptospiraceae bacterium]|nr:MFS transporter [Leptospiraceae bacterium]